MQGVNFRGRKCFWGGLTGKLPYLDVPLKRAAEIAKIYFLLVGPLMGVLMTLRDAVSRALWPGIWSKGFLSQMDAHEARRVLGLYGAWGPQDVAASHRALLLKNHPDRGGSSYLALKINEARALLAQEPLRGKLYK